MTMPQRRWLLLLALAGASCVADFGGAKIQLTIAGATPTPTGRHLELWARDNDQVVRILYGDSHFSIERGAANLPAYAIVKLVDENDPCMIDPDGTVTGQVTGRLLVDKDAYLGTEEEKVLRAKATEERIREITKPDNPMLAIVVWDGTAPPPIAPGVTPEERLAKCRTYWGLGYVYTGNPLQLTAPIHGVFLGAVDYTSTMPVQVAGGAQITTAAGLRNLQELWLTEPLGGIEEIDADEINCDLKPKTCRGRLYLQGNARPFSRGVVHIEMSSPVGGVSGAASIITHLDDDPVQF